MLKRFKRLFKKNQSDGGAQRGDYDITEETLRGYDDITEEDYDYNYESVEDEPREGGCQTVTGYEYQ